MRPCLNGLWFGLHRFALHGWCAPLCMCVVVLACNLFCMGGTPMNTRAVVRACDLFWCSDSTRRRSAWVVHPPRPTHTRIVVRACDLFCMCTPPRHTWLCMGGAPPHIRVVVRACHLVCMCGAHTWAVVRTPPICSAWVVRPQISALWFDVNPGMICIWHVAMPCSSLVLDALPLHCYTPLHVVLLLCGTELC